MKNKLAILGALVVLGQNLIAGEIGIGYGVTTPIYHNDKNSYILPIINLEYDNFFVTGASRYGLSLGYKLLEEDNYVLSLYGMPFGGYELKNSDMKDGYKGIEDRDTYIMGGAELTYYPGIYNLKTALAAEYGEKGGHFSLKVSRPYQVSNKLTLVPSLNYVYYDSNFMDYYFGIDSNEINNDKIRETYSPNGGHRVEFGILGNYRINDTFSLMGFTGVTKLSSEISDSPIVDNDLIYIFGTGIIYTF